jgi:motility quorum-sensing regulator/GCU-specific mRNA interferase toxin
MRMEKRRPHHDLEAFKAVCGNVETLAITWVAAEGAATMRLTRPDVARIVRTMSRGMFVKSMTSYHDHRTWQDVYHVPLADGRIAYVKFRDDVITRFVLLSFKDRYDG